MMKLFDEETIVKADYGKFYLDDIFKQEDYRGLYGVMMDTKLYPISFLDKTACGNGGTTGMIRYALDNDKGLLVLVPNVSIVKDKEKDFKGENYVCCVYGESTEFNPEAQIVVATYDQFPRLLRELRTTGINARSDIFKMSFWAGRTIVVDEYHKLIDDSGYRKICWKVTEMVTKVKQPIILMSATPSNDYAVLLRKLCPLWVIRKYTVTYDNEHKDYDTRLDIWEAKKGQIKDVLYTMLNSGNNKHICVFYNSVADIKKLLGQLDDDRIEVLCSSQSKDKVGKYYADSFNEDKKLHFMTSAYFTGHDIRTDGCKCVIVVSNEFDYMCISERDIKQIIGRFRIAGGGVRHNDNHIWYVKTSPDQKNYLMNRNTYDKITQDINIVGDKITEMSDGIEKMHTLLRTQDILRRFEVYGSVDKLAKSLTDYGYKVVKRGEITGFSTLDKKRHITFKKAKEMVRNGLKIDFDTYPDINELEAFAKVNGMSSLGNTRNTKTVIHNWYSAYVKAKEQDLERNDACEVFGIQNFGRYNAGYLMACLEYLGEERNYDKLPKMMKNTFKKYVMPWKLDSKGKKQDHTWLVITDTPKSDDFFTLSINNKEEKKSSKLGVLVIDHKLSYETSNNSRSCARTSTLDGILRSGGIPVMSGIPLYDWVNQDKATRLPGVKKGNDWSSIKRFNQGKISEMYADTLATYRYVRSEMNLADYIICDIDGGMTFSEFKEEYKEWTWMAYPTINNLTDDWTKFRVIVPLVATIRLEGEHNLKVLKALRTMFCPYEDPDHQVYSYINYEDFKEMRTNDGNVLEIPQDFVDCLNLCITTSYDYNNKRFNKEDVKVGESGNSVKSDMTLDKAKALFLKKLADPTEGARHRVLYPIKKGLTRDDRKLFEDWLSDVAPAYLSHWRSHKV